MKARVLALYLPQYHPIPENDEWWGKGFTEWLNVAKTKPLFKGHYQPKLPVDLGFYDLRLPQVREQQAQLAKEAGVEGFIYWHYWFGGGKMLLEKPFEEVLSLGNPDFPFCLAWANHTWSTKTWRNQTSTNTKSGVIAEQTYPGVDDYEAHFCYCLKAFKDSRYVKVDNKPVFFIYDSNFSDVTLFIKTWRILAKKNGLEGIHFIGMKHSGSLMSKKTSYNIIKETLSLGFDAVSTIGNNRAESQCGKYVKLLKIALNRYLGTKFISKFNQKNINKYLFCPEDSCENVYPTILPNWDRTARGGVEATVYVNSTPFVFRELVKSAVTLVSEKNEQNRIIVLKSWNEWGEGNYVEPDIKYGHGYLEALKDNLF